MSLIGQGRKTGEKLQVRSYCAIQMKFNGKYTSVRVLYNSLKCLFLLSYE